MKRGPGGSVLREIRALYGAGTVIGLTDAELLERFLARGGEAEDAFAALVARHGPTVLGVCRRMLPGSHDAEDAFQATFLVLARRAASIGRREKLANWLHGVAVRTAREARRRAVRSRALEKRLMDATRTEPGIAGDDPDDWLPMLDEELHRLPRRYREALVACELEGRSRREAARQLGIPEGTLSTHLARGRKLLRDRMQRRGVSLGLGPIVGGSRPPFEATIPERLMEPTVRAAVGSLPGAGVTATTTVSSLAERVLKMMFLARLTLVVAALMTAAAGVMAAAALAVSAPAAQSPAVEPPKAGPDDLPGRVVDGSGPGVAGARVWAGGGFIAGRVTVASATTDGQGRFLLTRAWGHKDPRWIGDERLDLFARSRDGRVGWGHIFRGRGVNGGVAIVLGPVAAVRGRVTDQDGRPIGGAAVAVTAFWRPTDTGFSDPIFLTPEPAAPYRTTTDPDGAFVLEGIPRASLIVAAVEAQGLGTTHVSWNTTQSATIAIDRRRGRIEGRLRPPEGGGPSGSIRVSVRYNRPAGPPPSGPVQLQYNKDIAAGRDGSFRFDGLAPGRYTVEAVPEGDVPFIAREVDEIEVRPDGVAAVVIPLERVVTIKGRVLDARTGEGIAGIAVACYRLKDNTRTEPRFVQTGADGRYSVAAQPGMVYLELQDVPKTYITPTFAENPSREIRADQAWPDLKLTRAATIEGIVVDEQDHPVAGAEVMPMVAELPGIRRRDEPIRTAPDGTFRLEQLDPDDRFSLWARAGDATTDGEFIVRPRDVKGRLTLKVAVKSAARIRGQAVDSAGKRVAGAMVTLWWYRSYATEKAQMKGMGMGSVLETAVTGSDGWFVFRNLWPGARFRIVVEARGHGKAEAPELTTRAGETNDVGKLVLINTTGRIDGRVVGSDGRPVAGAEVFNRGDGPELVKTSTDSDGRFRLDGLYPGTKFAFVRKEGYRFTGARVDGDRDDLTITLLRAGEPPPAWKPRPTASHEEQRAFAREVLIRLWAKDSPRWCIDDMAELDPELARRWSGEKGHRHDDDVRHVEARNLAGTDPEAALALLNQKPDRWSQGVLQDLADQCAVTDRGKALRFAEEAAVQSRGLNQPDRTLAMARAGDVLVKLGRADAGRKLIDEAARDAMGLSTKQWSGGCRAQAARIVAAYDVERALAIVEPFRAEDRERWQANVAAIGAAIATTDTKRALTLVDSVGGYGFDHELARTAIAYRIGPEHPDEAIRVVEGIQRNRWAPQWQAGAFGWLAVAIAPRDRARAIALIDRALALTIDNRDWAGPGDEMAVAARVAACARRIDYPDMEGAIMRVMAARPGEERNRSSDRDRIIERLTIGATFLALVDPEAARVVLEQIEARGGLDPIHRRHQLRSWLTAWALVDLPGVRSRSEAAMAALDGDKEGARWRGDFFVMIDLLIAPPDRREQVLAKWSAAGAYWRPDGEF